MSEPVGIALIGMGWWGKKMLERARARRRQDIRVVRAVEPNIETVQALCAEKGVPLSADYADALTDPTVEAVVLATPHSLHEAQIEAAVAAGKHVFCEKPLALTKAGAEKAVASAAMPAWCSAWATSGAGSRRSPRCWPRPTQGNSGAFTRSKPISATTSFCRSIATTGV